MNAILNALYAFIHVFDCLKYLIKSAHFELLCRLSVLFLNSAFYNWKIECTLSFSTTYLFIKEIIILVLLFWQKTLFTGGHHIFSNPSPSTPILHSINFKENNKNIMNKVGIKRGLNSFLSHNDNNGCVQQKNYYIIFL